jgi:hypothetical protein
MKRGITDLQLTGTACGIIGIDHHVADYGWCPVELLVICKQTNGGHNEY